jgi:LPXTG-motif cell wall-anchored protein
VLILFGAFLFISSTLFFEPGSDQGKIAIILGFVIGGIGFYLGFVRKKKET